MNWRWRMREGHFRNEPLIYGDPKRLKIGKHSNVNNAMFNLVSGDVVIEDWVMFGLGVSVITGTHDRMKREEERSVSAPRTGRDIIIKRGAWIASNATILGPCVIGENSVVAACSLIRHDVPPNTFAYSENRVVMEPL